MQSGGRYGNANVGFAVAPSGSPMPGSGKYRSTRSGLYRRASRGKLGGRVQRLRCRVCRFCVFGLLANSAFGFPVWQVSVFYDPGRNLVPNRNRTRSPSPTYERKWGNRFLFGSDRHFGRRPGRLKLQFQPEPASGIASGFYRPQRPH